MVNFVFFTKATANDFFIVVFLCVEEVSATSIIGSIVYSGDILMGAVVMEIFQPVELLTGANWETWKQETKVQLLHQNAWEFVQEKTKDESVPAGDEKDDGKTTLPALTWREEQDVKLRKTRAYTIIYQALSKEFKPLISNTTSGAEAWRILSDHFEPTTRARVIKLLDIFFNIRHESGENLGLFLCKIKNAAERLRDVGHQLQPLYIGYQMIRSLPADYQASVQSIYRWPDPDFLPDKIEAELLLEENRLESSQRDLGNISAYSSDKCLKPGNAFPKYSKYRPNKIGPCFCCGNYGHLISNCKIKLNRSNVKANSSVNESGKNMYCNPHSNDSNINYQSNVKKYQMKRNSSKSKNSKSKIQEISNVEYSSKTGCIFSETESNLIEFSLELCETSLSDIGHENTKWVFDTAATAHFCSNRNLYFKFEPVSDMHMSLAVGGKECSIEGKGEIHFLVKSKDGKYNKIILANVLYNPKLRRNLLSGVKLEKQGVKFVGHNGRIFVYDKHDNELFYALRKGDLYFLKPTEYICERGANSVNFVANQTEKVNVVDLWHERFCHINDEYMVNTSKNESVRGLPELSKLTEDCISCKLAKTKRISFKSVNKIRSKHPLELLHMDLCGPLPVSSHGGNRYFFSIIDDFSRKVTVYVLKNKSDVFHTFLRFQTRNERFLDRKIISIRTDGGLEFCNRQFDEFLEKQGINHEKTNPYSPEMNGCAERFNLTALDGVKTLLNASGLSQKFWAEALLCFTYVWNRICHKNCNKTPFEYFCSRKPSVTHLKKFGCLAYVGVPKQNRRKLDMRAKLGIMCGYAQMTKGYRIWLVEEQKIIETINVRFDENKRGVDVKNVKQNFNFSFINFPEDGNIFSVMDDYIDSKIKSDEIAKPKDSQIQSSDEIKLTPCSSIEWTRIAKPRKNSPRTDIYYGIQGTNVKLRSTNDVIKYCKENNINFDGDIFDFCGKNEQSGKVADFFSSNVNLNSSNNDTNDEVNLIEVKIPKSYKEACQTPESSQWKEAMSQEIKVMYERKVWELIEPPKGAQILGSRWVYTVKQNEKNEIVRFKARLVAQGFNQIKGLNYDEVFSPVVNFAIIRLFFSIFVCHLKWSHIQVDVNNAYLYADLDRVIYMQQPEGYVKENGKICKLSKALYGLHQSGRQWFFEIDDVLLKLKFKKLKWCNCAYVFENKIVLLLYVDDIIIFGKSKIDLNFCISLLSGHFNLKILGPTRKLLGIQFEEGDRLYIHQISYIEKVCQLYKKYNFPIASVPLPKGLVLSKIDCPTNKNEIDEMAKFPYRNLIGCLSFIANRTRPDIMFAVNFLSQFQTNPGIKHWVSLLKLLGYLQYTKNFKLELSKVTEIKLSCFSDSDFAANRDDRVSIGGYILFLDESPIVWKTFKQKCISLSTMEAEFVTLTEAAKELLWFKNVLENESLNLSLKECNLFCDNQAAIAFSNSPVENQKTKHIHIKYLFLRNLIYEKAFNLKYVPSKLNLADPFTKAQIKDSIMNFCQKIFKI